MADGAATSATPAVKSDIRIASLAPQGTTLSKVLAVVGPGIDRLLGISAMRGVYERYQLQGLAPEEFIKTVLKGLEVKIVSRGEGFAKLPKEGPVLVVCNHPFGGMEALIVLQELLAERKDVKALGNVALQIFRELEDALIFTNPLISSQKNLPSLRQTLKHLNDNGVVVIFPAGRVSYYRKDLKRVTDHQWNRLIGHLLRKSDAQLMPIHISGSNSRLFLVMGYIWSRFKILMLPREMLKLRGKTVSLQNGSPTPNKLVDTSDIDQTTKLARLLTYLQGIVLELPKQTVSINDHLDIAEPFPAEELDDEVNKLPSDQILITYKKFVVGYGSQAQLPKLVHEITRQRERAFREFEEGSGKSLDTDEYDAKYTHLFVWDTQGKGLLGAYRIGHSDQLRADGDVYLSQMFDFADEFFTDSPRLELGRSFVTPEYQKSHVSLHLLWRGIGAYWLAHPKYRKVYGTVSLSRQYDLRSIAAMCDTLIEPDPLVSPKFVLETNLGPDWQDYKSGFDSFSLPELSRVVSCLEEDNKDIPVLLRHYYKSGAKFLGVAVDPNFNNTPGLLLEVDIDQLPESKRKTYVS